MIRVRLQSVGRIVLSAILMALIFHVIFCNEVQTQLAETGQRWESIPKWEQRRLAWTRGPSALWETTRQLDPINLAIAFGACGLLVVIGGFRWRLVLRVQGLQLSWAEVMRISFIAHFFNAFLLGTAGGDVVKAWYVARAAPERRPEAALTVFADRVLGALALLIFAVICAIPNAGLILRYPRHWALFVMVLGMLVVAGLFVVLGFYTNALQPGRPMARWAAKLPMGGSFVRALAACRTFGHHPGFLLEIGLWSLLVNVCIVLAYAALARGLHLDIPWITLAYVSAAVVSVAAIPVTPAGLGVRENLFVWLLATPIFDVKPGIALSLSLLGYTVNLAWSVVGGMVYLLAPSDTKQIVRATSNAAP